VDWRDVGTRKRLALFDRHQAGGIRVRCSPDGRHYVLAGFRDGWMRLWDMATQTDRPIGRDYRSGVHDLAFSADGRRLFTAGNTPNEVVKIWDMETGRDEATLPGIPGLLFHRIGFSPDGNTLFASSLEGVALLWHAPSWDEIVAREKAKRAP
jgi:WD40 repeat protein